MFRTYSFSSEGWLSSQEICKFKVKTAPLPTHIELNSAVYDMDKDSVVLLEQLRTIDKKRLKDKVCHLDGEIMRRVDRALMVSLELDT